MKQRKSDSAIVEYLQGTGPPSRSKGYVMHKKGHREEEKKCFKLLQSFCSEIMSQKSISLFLGGPNENWDSTSFTSRVTIL